MKELEAAAEKYAETDCGHCPPKDRSRAAFLAGARLGLEMGAKEAEDYSPLCIVPMFNQIVLDARKGIAARIRKLSGGEG